MKCGGWQRFCCQPSLFFLQSLTGSLALSCFSHTKINLVLQFDFSPVADSASVII